MKTNLIVCILMLVTFLSCDKGTTKYITQIELMDINNTIVDGADVYIYKTKEDFLLRQNEALLIKDNHNDKITIDMYDEHLWIYAVKDDINSYRHFASKFSDKTGRTMSSKGCCEIDGDDRLEIIHYDLKLMTTPTKLEFQVFHEGQPIVSKVKLYYTEEGYNNDVQVYDLENIPDAVLNKTTDSDGRILFEGLSTRKYWFRITTEDGLSNDGGTISLAEPLPDNPDITTSITIGIN